MKQRLLWKLLIINVVPVIGVIILVIYLAINQLAADYFMTLMDKYDVSPIETHRMFLAAIHRYLVWAAISALALALLLSFLLTRRVLRPLSQMTHITGQVAAGNFSERVVVTSSDEIGQLGAAFNRMADGLEKLEQLRKRMVADVAHELRTPLTNLRGYMEGLSDDVIVPSKETFQMLQQEILRLVDLVEDLAQLAKADAAKAYLKKESLCLQDLVEQMLVLCQSGFQDKQVRVNCHFSPEVATITADRDKILQALRNLIENAFKYTPAEGDVEISAVRKEGHITVRFINSGPGIAEDHLPYIFERFYRADPSRSREGGGAGIGLSIVKELIEAHGGCVGAESKPGRTCIWFNLPV